MVKFKNPKKNIAKKKSIFLFQNKSEAELRSNLMNLKKEQQFLYWSC